MQYKKNVNNILAKLTKEIPIVEEGDLFIADKTVYRNHSNDKPVDIEINGERMSMPLAASAIAKSMMIKDGSLLSEIYSDTSSGDILKVLSIKEGKIICENMSIKPEFRKEVIIDKWDVMRGDFKLVERISSGLKSVIEKIKEET